MITYLIDIIKKRPLYLCINYNYNKKKTFVIASV